MVHRKMKQGKVGRRIAMKHRIDIDASRSSDTLIGLRLPRDLLAEVDAIVKVERRNRGNAVLVLVAEALEIRRILNADKELQTAKTEARLRAIRQVHRSPP
jgi:metal-responsive CopG/Arc/MetJ family transcriptional regulator